jgi:hypothetical protein
MPSLGAPRTAGGAECPHSVTTARRIAVPIPFGARKKRSDPATPAAGLGESSLVCLGGVSALARPYAPKQGSFADILKTVCRGDTLRAPLAHTGSGSAEF